MDRVQAIIVAAGVKGETRLVAHALFSALNGIMISYARVPGVGAVTRYDAIPKDSLKW